MRTPIKLPVLNAEQIAELDRLYRTTINKRVRTRAQVILLAAEQKLLAPQIAAIVRETDETVRNCLKRYLKHGIAGLADAPKSGRPGRITQAYQAQLVIVVRRRPRSLGLPYSMWTLQRLVDYLAEQTGICVSYETVRLVLKKAGISLSRPQHKISSPDPEYLVKKRRLKTLVTD
jgi:transposase